MHSNRTNKYDEALLYIKPLSKASDLINLFCYFFKVANKVIYIIIDPYINVFGIMVWIFCHTYNKKVFTLAQIWTILVFASPRPTKSLMNPLENQNATAVTFLSYSSFNFPIRFLSNKKCHKIWFVALSRGLYYYITYNKGFTKRITKFFVLDMCLK